MPKMPYYTFPAILSLNQPFRYAHGLQRKPSVLIPMRGRLSQPFNLVKCDLAVERTLHRSAFFSVI
ncbi:hypothetical protein HBH56_047990 [Parastagonospora nodorum]|uniref:Uncharacterized protein n=1 Tax=Phaeosphaeria nodorum (strain SN15 / ATCC MYA-4574 / FGSC 10173) TaxID=321614 RepID=A0A7U2HVR7_PHANO|nr:hypothetical protein HBH56_047990 [Parastagonospora nodorum]QRC92488.1 hypothetical protein JI435_305950 [Parastagonospora nodorum SN15]KAH3933166.1 hypothetical protein HBH54_075730 [Parastagonospora nodorum]KAH3957279.1 hypothetical protein HBH51_227100 [Parastagonospora nodorum]KAH3972977.1 hypothetical protein HBH52_147780 [Parastagonospora nodorum]